MKNRLNTYSDYSEILHQLLNPIVCFYNEESSVIALPDENETNYPISEVHLENFGRSLIGLCLLDISKDTITTIFQMIKNGIDKDKTQYWGNIKDCSQTQVELFPILHFCLKNKVLFDDNFSKEEKEKLNHWFLQINHTKVCDNNWFFFPILINLFLKRLELDYSEDIIQNYWKAIDNFYLGNGWYSDGKSRQRDYYIAFTFHFYSLLYAFYSDDEYRKEIILDRANMFAQSFIYFFADTGETVAYGRSLTYKFAQVAFWSIYANYFDDRKRLGIIKGIVNRNLRWWFSQNIFDSKGFLVNGYAYSNPFLLEQYNGSGSPFWALKAFFCLLNPKSEYFLAEELPLPELKSRLLIPEAYLTIYRSCGHAYAFINGQKTPYFCGNVAKYERFVYSSLFGFNVSRSDTNLSTMAPDSTLSIKIGNSLFLRRDATVILNDEDVEISDWNPIPGVIIRSYIFGGAPWHIRVHYMISDQNVELTDYGFAVKTGTSTEFSEIRSNHPRAECGFLQCAPNTNILYSKVEVPYSRIYFSAGKNVFVTYVYGNKKPCYEYPNVSDIIIKHRHLFFNGKSYSIPKYSFRDSLHRLFSIIKIVK